MTPGFFGKMGDRIMVWISRAKPAGVFPTVRRFVSGQGAIAQPTGGGMSTVPADETVAGRRISLGMPARITTSRSAGWITVSELLSEETSVGCVRQDAARRPTSKTNKMFLIISFAERVPEHFLKARAFRNMFQAIVG